MEDEENYMVDIPSWIETVPPHLQPRNEGKLLNAVLFLVRREINSTFDDMLDELKQETEQCRK